MSPRPRSATAQWIAALLAIGSVAVGLWLAFRPCAYHGEGNIGGHVLPPNSCVGSSVEVNGAWILWVNAIPAACCVAGLIAAPFGKPYVLYPLSGSLIVFCVLAVFSIGLFFLPAGLLLLFAAGLTHIARDRVRWGG